MTDDPQTLFDLLEAEAIRRAALHADHASSRPLSDDYELVGFVGEAEFARVFKQPLNFDQLPGGDGGIDFVLPLRFTVDVKAARKPGNLIQEVGKVIADIYVLARHRDGRLAELLGWEWGAVLARAPTKDFGYGIINHYIAAEKLQPIDRLLNKTMRLR